MELQFIRTQIIDSFEGDPWFGKNIASILSEIDESIAFLKPSGQHSIVELIWHMINWREFTISRLTQDLERIPGFLKLMIGELWTNRINLYYLNLLIGSQKRSMNW